MQRLSMLALTAIAVLALSGAGFTKARTIPALGKPADKAQINYYYFYSVFDGSYNDFETIDYEIWEMEIYFDAPVNQNPTGGTLIEKGYVINQPSTYPPNIFLYAHF